MTNDVQLEALIAYWFEMADQSLLAAQSELSAAREHFAVGHLYYGCFYAATAFFLGEGRSFRKHAAIRAAIHRDLVHQGHLDQAFGAIFDRLFEERHLADYEAFITYEHAAVAEWVEQAEQFIEALKQLYSDKSSTAGGDSHGCK